MAAPWQAEQLRCTGITEDQFGCNKIANFLRTVCSDQFESHSHLRQNRHFETVPCELQCPCKLWRWKDDQPTRASGCWRCPTPYVLVRATPGAPNRRYHTRLKFIIIPTSDIRLRCLIWNLRFTRIGSKCGESSAVLRRTHGSVALNATLEDVDVDTTLTLPNSQFER
jgi:hypothetical protein